MSARRIRLLREALDLDESDRAAFVDAACRDDPALGAELHRLLALDAEQNPLLDQGLDSLAAALIITTPGAMMGDDDGDLTRVGDVIGPWRAVRRIGVGGMGSVWLAERADDAFSQHVALKMIKPGMDSQAVLAAFSRERDLLARLEHPCIAHLIDGGIDSHGRPWYAMRYVEGVELGRWLESAPPLRARLSLFVALCRTVAHAHRQLVVHRDLKPANIIVQDDGTPCLLDFGIAKILLGESDGDPGTIERFVSPGYAAPEQIQGGPISTVTDVYGLGAILFELLTGVRYRNVYSGGDVPTRPSQALKSLAEAPSFALPVTQLRGDLDAIVTRALASEPARRYGSADALADDVQRHMDARPVMARPDGRLYRIRKWITRNRLAAASLLIGFIAMLAGTGVSLWHAQRAQAEAERATTVKDYLISLFDAGRTNSVGTRALERPVIDMLDDSAARLKDELRGQPELRDELYTILVEIYHANYQLERATALAQERIAQAEVAFGINDPRVAPSVLLLAGVNISQHKMDDVPVMLNRAEALLDDAGDPRSLSRGLLLQYRGKYAAVVDVNPTESLELLGQAVSHFRRYHPDSEELVIALMELAQVAAVEIKNDIAYAALEEMRQHVLRVHGPVHVYIAHANFMQARLMIENGQPEEGLALMLKARTDIGYFLGEHHNDVLATRYFEVIALIHMRRFDEAYAAWDAVNALRQQHHADKPHLAAALQDLRERIDKAQLSAVAH